MPATPLSVNVMKLGPIGLASAYPYTDDAAVVADEARQAESLGFATRWRSGNLPMLEAAVRATNTIPVATGITPVSAVPDQVVVRIIGVDDLPAWRERLARALIGWLTLNSSSGDPMRRVRLVEDRARSAQLSQRPTFL